MQERIKKALWNIWGQDKMKELLKKYEEVIRYLIVGMMTTVVCLMFFYGSTWTFLDGNDAMQLQIANIISWIGSNAFAYGMNRRYVFQSKNPHMFKELLTFLSSRVVTLLLDMVIMHVGTIWMECSYMWVKWFSIVIVTIVNYLVGKLWVFRKK